MKATVGLTQSTTWKRIRARHVVLAAGAAVVAGALLSGAELRTESQRSSPAGVTRAAAPILSQAPGHLVVTIVGSEAERKAVERDVTFKEWFSEPGAGGPSTVVTRVIVMEPGEEESLGVLSDLLPEAGLSTGHGPKLTLLDRR